MREAPHVDLQILTSGVSKANGEKEKLKAAINSLVGSPLVVTRDLWKMKPGHKPPHTEELHCSEAWQEAGLPHTGLPCLTLPYPSATLRPSLRQRVVCSALQGVILSHWRLIVKHVPRPCRVDNTACFLIV